MNSDPVSELRDIILNGIFSKCSLEQMLSDISLKLGLEIQIADLTFSLIMSFPDSREFRYADFICRKRDGEFAEFFRAGRPVEYSTADTHFYLCPIILENTPLGIVSVADSHDGDPGLLEVAATRISQLCRKLFGTDIYVSPFNSLLNSLLTHYLFLQDADGSIEAAYPLISESRFLPPYLMMIFRSTATGKDRIQRADRNLERYLPKAIHFVHNGCLNAFLDGASPDCLNPGSDFIVNTEGFCRTYGLLGTVSPLFEDLKKRSFYKEQLHTLIRICPDGDALVLADEQYTRLLNDQAVSRFGKEYMFLSQTRALADYDLQYGTDYLMTLKAYLDNSNRIAAAAKQLFIDHSTMKYRLKKICAMIDSDIDEPETAIRLRFSLLSYQLNIND